MVQKKTRAAKGNEIESDILRVDRQVLRCCVLGESPLILNRMAEKAKRQLLLPHRKTAADRAGSLKHYPLEEFRSAATVIKDEGCSTLLAMPAGAFHRAIASAALDTPGARKAEIGRLTWVPGEYMGKYLPVFGRPFLGMDVVRSSDINRTPDIRTRVILPEWALYVSVSLVVPNLQPQSVLNLLANAGVMVGVGDNRVEKGADAFGRFRLVNEDDPEFQRILEQGRAVQRAAMDTPEAFDDDAAELLAWSIEETKKRGFAKKPEPVEDNGHDLAEVRA